MDMAVIPPGGESLSIFPNHIIKFTLVIDKLFLIKHISNHQTTQVCTKTGKKRDSINLIVSESHNSVNSSILNKETPS